MAPPQPHGTATIGLIQFAGIPGEKPRNIDTATRLIREGAAAGAQVVMTPEVALSGFVGGDAERAMAEAIPGPSTDHFAALARELDCYILVGLSELRDGHLYNAMVTIDRQGEVVGVMRKVHINRHEIPGGWRNGSEFPVWRFETETGAFTGGIMICYDREHPESARLLMLQGADVIFNPLACPCPTDDIHRCLLRTRAFENEVYLCMVNHAAPRENGHSMVIDPEGTIVEEAGEEETVLVTTLDLDRLKAYRENSIYGMHHRRPELYGPLCDTKGRMHPPEANLP